MAVGGFSDSLAMEVAPFGVKVYTLEPGGIRTNWARRAGQDAPELLPEYEASVGAILELLQTIGGRQEGDPRKIADRIVKLANSEEITTHSEWSIQFRWLLANEPEPDALSDLCFVWVLCVARHGTGTRISPLRLELMQPRKYAKTLERHFGCPIVSGAARNAIVFRVSDAELPFVTRNAELLAMLAPQFDEELKQHSGQQSFPERVRAVIQSKLTGRRPKMQEIAHELHISTRTLQRRLQDEDYSFQQVLEEARHQLARHYLNGSELELNETVYLLGYGDANSFVRAFRMWEGVPPSPWREARG